jgi:hypothetical protein
LRQDNLLYCQDAADLAAIKSEGTPGGAMFRAVNNIADALRDEFPTVAIDTLAYQWSRAAPKLTKPKPNVIIRLCSIECNFAQPLSHPSNAKFQADISNWGEISKRLYVWNYVTNFNDFMVPFPDYPSWGPNTKFYAEHGVVGLYQEGTYTGAGGDMSELKDFVLSQLMFDPSLDAERLISQFLVGYYGERASIFVRQYMDTMHSAVADSEFHLGCFFDGGAEADFLTPLSLLSGATAFARARAVTAPWPSPFAIRLGGSALPLEWVLMQRWAELRRFASQEKLPWPLEDSAAACFARWARAFNATEQRYSLPIAFREDCGSSLQCKSPLQWAHDQILFRCPGGDGYAERQMPVAVNVSSFYPRNAPTLSGKWISSGFPPQEIAFTMTPVGAPPIQVAKVEATVMMTPPGPATHELLIEGVVMTTWHSTSNGELLTWSANSTAVMAGTVTVRTTDNNHTAWVAWGKIKIMGGCAHNASRLHLPGKSAYYPLPVGSIAPRGWLLKQLEIQANGLSGHLAMFWPPVSEGWWVGGTAGDTSAVPYWLNGLVPLAYQLKAAGIEEVKPTTSKCSRTTTSHHMAEDVHSNALPAHGHTVSVEPVRPLDQVNTYIHGILGRVGADGLIGPPITTGDSYYVATNAVFSLIQYAEAEETNGNPDIIANISAVVLSHYLRQYQLMTQTTPLPPLASFAKARWVDIIINLAWLVDHNVGTNEQQVRLMALAQLLRGQGTDWDAWFASNFTTCTDVMSQCRHNVNNAMALKSAAVWYRFSGNATLHTLSHDRMTRMDEFYGLPTGMFNGDEWLPEPATRNPSRGIETCGVVESMFSYSSMFAIHGDVRFADRAERIAFNALPAAFASPRGGDMWAHPYLQAVNEINAVNATPHVWQHDGPVSETFGLAPTLGCCTSNHVQGWPKLISQAVMATKYGGAVVALLLPVAAKLPDGARVLVETDYPFEDAVQISYTPPPSRRSTVSLYIRVPTWATHATINGTAVPPGKMSKHLCPAGDTTVLVMELAPDITVEQWAADKHGGAASDAAYSVVRGPLLFSLPIAHSFSVYGRHFGSGDEISADYFLRPTQPWRYSLAINFSEPLNSSLVLSSTGPYTNDSAPFNRSGTVSMAVQARLLPPEAWPLELNSAAPPPRSPACAATTCGPLTTLTLVPHGFTELRIGEFPLAFETPSPQVTVTVKTDDDGDASPSLLPVTPVVCVDGADSTAILAAAFNQSHSSVNIAGGHTCVSEPLQIRGEHNLTVTLSPRAEIQAKRGSKLFGALLTLEGASDITIQGVPSDVVPAAGGQAEDPYNLTVADLARPTLRMWREEYLDRSKYVYSEWRHVIQIEGCSRLTLHNLRLTNSGGDGIYVLGVRGAIFSAITSDHNFRQGMSVIGAQGLVVSDSVFAFTRGTAPMAGIDFEPNEASQQITGVEVHSTRLLRNAGSGVAFTLHAYTAASPPCSVLLNNTLVVGPLTAAPSAGGRSPTKKHYRRWGMLFEAWSTGLPSGQVEFIDTTVVDTVGWGSPVIWVEKPCQLTVAFRNLTVNMSNGGSAIALSAIEPTSGGVVIDGAHIDRTCCPGGSPFSSTSPYLAIGNNGPNKIFNVSVQNVTVEVSAQDSSMQAENECSAELPATATSQGIFVSDVVCGRAAAKTDDDSILETANRRNPMTDDTQSAPVNLPRASLLFDQLAKVTFINSGTVKASDEFVWGITTFSRDPATTAANSKAGNVMHLEKYNVTNSSTNACVGGAVGGGRPFSVPVDDKETGERADRSSAPKQQL